MSNSKNEIDRLWKLQAKLNMMVLDGKRDATRVADLLQSVLDESQLLKGGELSIDCDAQPFIPDGWTVVEHRKGGQLEVGMSKFALYLSEQQKNGGVIKGDMLRKELESQPVLNANDLDYLLANQHLIPEDWKGNAIFFWGTIYCNSRGYLCVRYLYWDGESWCWYNYWLSSGWDGGNPAAVLSAS